MVFRLKFAAMVAALLGAYAIWTSAEAAVSPVTHDPDPAITQAAPVAPIGGLTHALVVPAPLIRLAKSKTTAASACKEHCKSEGAGCKQLVGGMPGAAGLGYGSACISKVKACLKKC